MLMKLIPARVIRRFVIRSFDIPQPVNCEQSLSCVATSVLRMRLLHVVAFSKKLRWLAQTKVITLKTQLRAVDAR